MGMFLSLAPRITTVADPTFIDGYLDVATLTGVSGWAGPGPTHVTVTVNGVLAATVLTDQARPDVLASPGRSGYGVCGFSYSFAATLDATINQTIVVACQSSTITNGSKLIVGGGGGGTGGYVTDPSAVAGAVVVQGLAATMPNNDTELFANPNVLFYEPFDSVAAMQTRWQNASTFYGTSPSIDQPTQFFIEPKSGIKMMQIPIQKPLNADDFGNGGTGCSWRAYGGGPDQSINEMWHRYLFYIDPDVTPVFNSSGVQTQGMTEVGMKMPGMAGAYEQAGQWNYGDPGPIDWWSYRMEFLHPVNGVYPFVFYRYDYTNNVLNGNPFGDNDTTVGNIAFRPGQYYCIEQRIKLNTMTGSVANANGEIDIWVDGVLCFSERNRKIRNDARAQFDNIPFANIFHGGHTPPVGRINMRYGGIVTAKQYIGPPKRVVSSYRTAASDTFFAGLSLNTWIALPNSAMTNLIAQTRAGYLEYGTGAQQGTQGRTIDANGLSGMFNWGGACWNETSGDLLGDAGGHTSSNNNSVWKFSPELAAAGDSQGGWRYLRQPSLYSQADYDAWILKNPLSGNGVTHDCHFELGWNYPSADEGTWIDGQPTSRHSYNSPVIWKSGNTYIRSSACLTKNGFWLYDTSSGSYSFVAGNGFFGNSSAAYLQGNNVVDETKNILLGFQNWPNGASIGVRRFDLNTKTDLTPIDLTNQVLSQASNWTAGLYYTETTWCQTGAGCMVGREFHYAMSEGSNRYFRVNIDTWVAKELTLTGLPARIGTAMVYSPDSGYLYAISCDTGALMRGNPFTGAWENAPAFGSGPIIDANLLVGVYGRFFYYAARKCLVLISASNDNVRVMRVA